MQYLAMGGHGGFVWPAYGFALVVLGGLVLVSLRDLRANEAAIAVMDAARPRRARGGAPEQGGSPNGDA